jgi:hypothetical protein
MRHRRREVELNSRTDDNRTNPPVNTTAMVVGSFAHLKEQAEGRKSRQVVLDYLADMMTSPDNPMDAEQMREFTATWLYFPEGRKLAEKIDAIYGDKPELHKTECSGLSLR